MRTVVPKDAVLIPEQAECVFRGVIYDVYQWGEKMFNGSEATYEMLKRPDSVEVIVIEGDKILIQYQEQPHLGSFVSFPGGRHDVSEETELDAAKRELKEESGIVCKHWKLVNIVQMHSKIDHVVYTFVASGVSDTSPLCLDAGEKIENRWVKLEEFKELLNTTKFRTGAKQFLEKINSFAGLKELPEFEEYLKTVQDNKTEIRI